MAYNNQAYGEPHTGVRAPDDDAAAPSVNSEC